MRIWGGYLLVLMAWVVAVMALAFLGFIICASITWQPSPLHDFLNWVRDYIVLVCIVTVLAGWVVISFYFISKPIKQLDVVANAAEQLSRPSEEPIQLPDSLEDISIQLNLAREQALRDARAAREAEQRKNDLIVYLAHDLKTPLTSVIGYLTLLRDEPQISPEIRARYTGIALEKAERLEDLINEFFDITRFNLSRLELERQSVDLTRMLEQVASEFRPIFAESGLSCSLDLPPKLHYSCDPDKLARVFDNLLRNASYYSLPDSTVEIAGRIEAEKIVLTFSNAGKNIPQEKLDRIFRTVLPSGQLPRHPDRWCGPWLSHRQGDRGAPRRDHSGGQHRGSDHLHHLSSVRPFRSAVRKSQEFRRKLARHPLVDRQV